LRVDFLSREALSFSPQELKAMKDWLEQLKQQGVEPID
jgi:hypothetical protein